MRQETKGQASGKGEEVMTALRPVWHEASRSWLPGASSASRSRVLGLLLAAIVLIVVLVPASAVGSQAPEWRVMAVSEPTNIAPGGDGSLVLWVANVGGGPTDGSSITIKDTSEAGLSVGGGTGIDMYKQSTNRFGCEPEGGDVTVCMYGGVPVDPGDVLRIALSVHVEAGVPEGSRPVNQVSVSGGGAPSAFASNSPVTVSSKEGVFGITPGSPLIALSTMQAGGHPNVTTMFTLNTKHSEETPGAPKDIHVDLPVGLVGDATGLTKCTMHGVYNELVDHPAVPECPADSVVGTSTTEVNGGTNLTHGDFETVSKVYAIEPAPGEPAAFAFTVGELGTPVRLDTSVLSNGDYGVRITVPDISEQGQLISSLVTIWGVPADHDGPGSDFDTDHWERAGAGDLPFGGPSGAAPVPLLTNPTQCSEPLSSTFSTDAWAEPGVFLSAQPPSVGMLTGCEILPFFPSISMLPDTLQAGAPAGYHFDLRVPRADDALPEGVAEPDVKNVTLALPMGTVISPSSANGLAACGDEQFALHSGVLGGCPRESQIGTVKITSPDIAEPLTGDVFLGAPLCDPCTPSDAQDGRMVRLFLQAQGEGEAGVIVKVEGTGSINQQTGQITTTFANNPQLPFNDLQLTLAGGPRATLANPSTCGPATSSADLTPWSSPFAPDATATSTFEVTGCTPPRFAPSFTAGTTSNQAGGFTPLTVAFGRTDADQDLAGLQMRMPPGLLGSLSQVPLCGEPQAAQGTCGTESLIGHVQVLTGPGTEPFLVTGGQVFLTGPYKGAPFGLSIVVPAKAGPYTLSGTTGTGLVVVRAAINVDPTTAALTVTSDPLPSVLDGIPLALKLVDVTIERADGAPFMFNPTSCDPMQVSGALTSTQGAAASVSSSFQVTNCAALKFEPKLSVSTAAHTSKVDGASLYFKIAYPAGAQGTESWFNEAKFDLPKQLPARLTTLQKACLAATFEANPGSCPEHSLIGHATVHTPVLPVPLSGPVYFVSYGGAKFPEAVLVLQGDGVTVDLHGETFINGKTGVTSATFRNAPDVPFESIEVEVPTGPFSEFGVNLPNKANGSFCGQKLVMPTLFKAQNGLEIHQNTSIGVTGCPKAKRAEAKKRAKASKSNAKRSAIRRGGHKS
jgi:hypothetical protein